MKVIIIEDEFAARNNLKALLLEYDTAIQVMVELDSIADATRWFQHSTNPKIDLVFLDIQLADGNCFEIFKRVDIPYPIIFTTAYDEYALEAFQVSSIDYLLKPIHADKLSKALDKYKNLQAAFNMLHLQAFVEKIKQEEPRYKSNLLIPFKDELIPLSVQDIAYLYIDHGVVKLCTHAKQTLMLSGKLEDFSTLLNPQHFFRINRQIIAAKSAIVSISQYFNGRLLIRLNPLFNGQVLVSKERVTEFKDWFTS